MKKTYDKNLVENLYRGKMFSYQELLGFLEEDDFEQKHFALTFIANLEKSEDIEFFIKNLVDQDTKIRELASFRVNDFVLADNLLMKFLDKHPQIVLRTANDVNPQVCRNICSLLYLSENKKYLVEQVVNKIEVLLENTLSIKFKSHKVNKDVFNLYWNIFALENLISKDFQEVDKICDIALKSSNYRDYTIRERVAFLSKNLFIKGFQGILPVIEKLKNDENFYVRKALD